MELKFKKSFNPGFPATFKGSINYEANIRIVDWGLKYSGSHQRNTHARYDEILKLVEGMDLITEYVYGTQRDTNLCYASPERDLVVTFIEDKDDNDYYLSVAADNHDTVEDFLYRFEELTPPITPKQENMITVRFWSASSQGPKAVDRFIDIHPWDSVENNYPTPVHGQLSELFEIKRPGQDSGKLILWHGPPGTGKTHAIRSLGYYWKDWCTTEYIVDPEVFFGSAAYMTQCILSDGGASTRFDPQKKKKYRLLIIEDAGEFIRDDAQKGRGQSMARLLNVADGLIGQGLKIIVLITTNEPLKALDKAVSRPGRCLAQVSFESFDRAAAGKWLEGQGISTKEFNVMSDKREYTLAELYHLKGSVAHIKPTEKPVTAVGQYL